MEKIIAYIENVTGAKNLSSKSWQEIVDTVVLPKMAGPHNKIQCRYKIHDMFMNFLAINAYDILCKDQTLAPILFEIGLQRLSCGAVLHDATPWPEPLPKKYWEYSSYWDEKHVMTEGCFNFILIGLEESLKFDMTRNHALKILFGLMERTDIRGNVENYSLGEFKDKAAQLYRHAEKLVEDYASFEEIYPYYARPGQWEKHIFYLSQHKDKINWDDFFEKTQAVIKKNFISRRLQRNAIRKRIERAAMPVTRHSL